MRLWVNEEPIIELRLDVQTILNRVQLGDQPNFTRMQAILRERELLAYLELKDEVIYCTEGLLKENNNMFYSDTYGVALPVIPLLKKEVL